MKKAIQLVVIIGFVLWSIPFLSAQSITNQGCIGFGTNPTNCGSSCENTKTVCAGTSVTISSCDAASGNGGCSVTYCWFKDGSSTPLPGATSATLVQSGLAVATHTYVRQAHCGTCDFAAGGFTASVSIVVVALPNAGTITGTSPLCIGATTTYTSNGDPGGIWSSSNPAFATVDANSGLVTGVAPGNCNIIYTVTAACGTTASAQKSITISPNVSAGTVSGSSPLCVNATTTYTSNGTPGGTWSSSNTAFATVNSMSGLVTGVAAGSCDIIYTVTTGCNSPTSAQKSITINPIVTAGTVTGSSPLCIGATTSYTSNGTAGGTWSSSNTGVATVNPTSGLVSGIAAGTCNIIYTVTAGCGAPVSALKSITISPNATAGTVSGSSPLCIGATTNYTSNGNGGGTWSSSNDAFATVNPTTGQVTGVAPGTCNIIYTVSTGCNAPVSAQRSITINPSANAGNVSGSSPLCIGATTTYTSNGNVGGSWSSSNTAIATVNATSGLVSGVAAGTCNIIYTVTSGCNAPTSAQQSITIIPNMTLALSSGAGSNIQTKCINTAINNITYNVGGSGTGANVNNLPAGVSGSFSSGVLTISGTPTAAGVFNYTVTTTGTCTAATGTGTITVVPTPTIATVSDRTICPATPVTIAFTGTPAGVLFDWTNSNTAIGLGGSGTGNISFNSTNSGTSPITGNISVTPKITQNAVTCFGAPEAFTITVNPTPVVDNISPQVVCNGNQTNAVNFNSSASGGTMEFTWTNNTPSIGLSASGSGNIAAFTATNTGNAPVVATITVTPKFTNGNITCNGTAKTFTITVNPTPKVNTVTDQFVCNGNQLNILFTSPTTGGTLTMNWTNSNPSIGLGASGSGNILFTSTNNTDAPISGMVTVTPSYNNAGVTCTGQPVVFTITINPTPKVDNITPKAHCNGSPTGIVDFTSPTNGVNMEFAWTNSNTAIGLGASGTGDLPSFTATNSSNAPIVATITVTPKFTNGTVTCTGTAKTFTITVNPTPKVNTVNSLTVCNGNNATVTFTSPTTGGTLAFAWTNDNPAIGLSAGGTGNFSFTATNAANTPISGVITVTPNFTNASLSCPGNPVTFTITVNPTPIVNAVSSFVGCNGVVTKVDFSSPTSGGTLDFTWTNNNTGIGLGASGTGNISFLSANSGNGPLTGAISVTPKITSNAVSCNGVAVNFTIGINPSPKVNTIANQPICNGGSSNAINFSSPNTGGTVTFSWTNNNTSIGLGGSGTGNIPPFTATNSNDAPSSGRIDVAPSFTNTNGGPTCDGTSTNLFTFIVNPTPKVNNVVSQIVCVSTPTNIPFSSPTTGGTMEFAWTNSNASIGLGASGSGNLSFTSVNGGNGPIVGNLVITPKFTNIITCSGNTLAFSITVNPLPKVNVTPPQVLCNGDQSAAINFNSPTTGGTLEFIWTNSNTAIGLSANGSGNIAVFAATNATFATIAGTINVVPKFTNTNGLPTCNGTASTFTITVNPSPQINNISTAPFCPNETVNLNFSSNPTGSTFAWTNTNTAIGLGGSGNGPISFKGGSNLTSGNIEGTVSATPTSDKGCKGAVKDFTLTLKPTPQLVQLPVFAECSGLPFNLLDFSINPVVSGTQNYSWSNSGVPGLAGTGTGQIPIFTPAANTTGSNILGKVTYIVTVTGCASTPKTYDVIIFPQPQLNLTLTENSGAVPNDGIVCETDQISIQAAATLSPSPFQFSWSNGSTAPLLLDNPAGPVSGVGSKSYTVTVTDNNGCKNSNTRTITVNKYPKVDISFVENSGNLPNDAQICSKDLIDLTANESNGSTGSYTFDWNASASKSKNITLNPTATGKQNYIVTVTNSGCKTTAIKEIEVFGLPVSGFTVLSTQLEIDKSITFENISTKFGTQDIILSKWTFSGSEFDSIIKGSPNPLIFVTNKFKQAGNQDITLKVTDNKGCMQTTTQSKFVNLPGCVTSPNKPVPYDGDKLCWNIVTNNYTLAKPRIKLQVIKTGGTSSYKAKWVLPSGIKFIGTDVLVQGDSVKNRDFEFEVDTAILPTNKEFNLRIEATDVSNCPNQNIDIPYIILAPLRGSLLFTPKSICNKTTADLKIQSGSTAPFTYTILRDNLTKTGGFSKADTTIVISNPDYVLNNNVFFLKELRDSFGCVSHPTKFDSAVLVVNPLPSFSIDTARCLPGNNQFYISFAIKNGKSPYSFVSDSITKNKGLSGALVGNQFVSDTIVSKDGGNSFLIKIIDALGCKDSVKSSIDCKGSCSILPGVFKSDTIKKCNLDNNDIVVDFLTPASGVTNGGNYFILVKENNLNLTTLILNPNLILYLWKGKLNLDAIKTKINIGELYHIYEIYGSDSSAVKKLTDACLRITALPKPIIFNNLPTIQTIKFAKDKICDGEEVDLNIRFTGSVPITFLINNKPATFSSLNDKIKYGKSGSDGYGNATSFEPKITNLEDKNGCKVDQPVNNFDKVTINPLPVITALSDLTFCKNKQNDVITVTHNTILNRTYIYKWTFPDTTNIRIKNQNTKTITIDLINDNVKGIPFNVEVRDGTTGCIDTTNAVVLINDGSSAPEIDTILKVKGNKSLDSYVMIYPDFSLCYEWQVDTTGTGDFSAAKNCNDGNGLAYCEYRKEFLNSNTKFQVKIWKKDGTSCDKNKACSNIATIVREGTLGGGVADPLQLILHPNPNEGEFNVTLAGGLFGNYRATIIDNVGRIVHQGQFEKTTYESKIEMNHGQLSNGIYVLQLRDQEGNYFNLKFIVQH